MRMLISFILLLALTSCSKKYIEQVKSDTKTKFGFEIPAPNKAVFFVENKNIGDSTSISHTNTANSMYHKYGPARDDFFIGRTNAKDLKFNLANKTYYIAVENLPKRTAMILFDGKHKPVVKFNPKKYDRLISKIK
ncbi:MAG: hypothetical protein ABIP95_04545 [Pelobium sp.]